MTEGPSFSIAIPAGPRFDGRLADCLASIAAQDVPVQAAFCDCSDAAAAHALSDQYAEVISYRRHGPDDGQSAAIEEGWAAVPGDILGWLNVDDRLTAGALQTVAGVFAQNPDIDVVYGQSIIFGDSGADFLHPEVQPPSELLYRSNIISQPSCFVRRRAIDAIGGINRDLHYVMDWDLWVRLMENGAPFHFLPDVLSEVYFGDGTKTGTLGPVRLKEIWGVLRRNCGLYPSAKSVLGFAMAHAGIYRRPPSGTGGAPALSSSGE